MASICAQPTFRPLTATPQELLDKTGLRPADVDILVTTCSIFCPTPSMSAMLVNHFKMRPDCQTYHLGGMGCGNGVIGIGMVKKLLQVGGWGCGCSTYSSACLGSAECWGLRGTADLLSPAS